MQAEIVESVMRPGAVGAVAKRHEHAEEKVQGDRADGNKSNVSGKVEDGHAHGRQHASIGFETARSTPTFHGMVCWFRQRGK